MCCHPPRRRREFGDANSAAGYGEHTLVVVAHHDLSRGKAPRKCESGLARSRSQVEDNPRASLLRSDTTVRVGPASEVTPQEVEMVIGGPAINGDCSAVEHGRVSDL